MIITKSVDVEFDTDDFDISDFDFSFEEIKEAIINLSNEEQKKLAFHLIQHRNYKEIKDMIVGLLENLGIDDAKALIKELDNEFLSFEECRERALKLQTAKNGSVK